MEPLIGKAARELIKLVLIAVKSNPCMDCGFEYPICVMDFDHLRDKKINIAQAAVRWTDVPKLLGEISKCDLVCSNCHRIRTWLRRKYMTEVKTKMTREQVTQMLKDRKRADGTPFKKHEGPRNQRLVTAQGLEAALKAAPTQELKVMIAQSFGSDGRKAMRELVEKDASLDALFKAAFPGAGTGRPYLDAIKTTKDGKAVVSGFDSEVKVSVKRNEDGSVVLTPIQEAEPADTPAIVQPAVA